MVARWIKPCLELACLHNCQEHTPHAVSRPRLGKAPGWSGTGPPADRDALPQVEEDPTGGKFANAQGTLNGAPNKLEPVINFHLGDTATALQKCTLQPGGQEVLLFSTISGAVGACLWPCWRSSGKRSWVVWTPWVWGAALWRFGRPWRAMRAPWHRACVPQSSVSADLHVYTKPESWVSVDKQGGQQVLSQAWSLGWRQLCTSAKSGGKCARF